MNQLEAIRAELAKPRRIESRGLSLELRIPSSEALLAIRDAARTEGDGSVPLLTLSGMALAACIRGLKEEEAVALVVRDGGEFGELAALALDLCGFNVVPGASEADSPL